MGRPWMLSARTKAITATLGLVAGLDIGCATVDAEPEARPKQPATHGGGFGLANDHPKLQACYTTAKSRDPALSVHTVVLFFARDGKVVFADVDLPKTPELARCLSDVILNSNAFEAPVAQVSGAASGGAFRIDLGPPLTAPVPRPKLAEMRVRERRAVLAALQQGALRASDPMVSEMLNPKPPWPTPELRAELDACHRDALRSHPGLVLHRDVIYLTRGGKLLAADVSIPEAPELQRCVLDRIAGWSSPFSSTAETTLSGFFVDLGAPEELPEPPRSLTAELDRRRALLQRALERGLIEADDPVLERFKYGAAARSREPRADEASGAH